MEKRDTNRKGRLVREWQKSGERKSDFAARHGIARSTFYHWTRNHKAGNADDKPSTGFQAIAVEGHMPPAAHTPTAIIHYSTGTTLELYGPLDSGQLRALIK